MNSEIIWWVENLGNLGAWLEVSDEAMAQVMEQSRKWVQASYRTTSNQALNNQIAKFLQYIFSHPQSDQILKVITVFVTSPNNVLFWEFCIFLAPFLAETADQFAINQIYNVKYRITNNKSEYISYINRLIEDKYISEHIVKNEEITTMSKLNFAKLNQEKLWYYVDYIIWVFRREDDTIAIKS